MKKIFLIITFSLVSLFLLGQEVSVNTFLSQIQNIRSQCDKLRDKNPKKSQGYKVVLEKQDTIIKFLQDSVKYYREYVKYEEYKEDALIFRFLNRSDIGVFTDEMRIDEKKLSSFMTGRYTAIVVIRKYYQCIKTMGNQIDKIHNNKDVPEHVKKEWIATKIQQYIDEANALFDEIDRIDMSSFSDEQKQFYQVLNKKYNNILDEYIFVK